jgi:hypothetical protein
MAKLRKHLPDTRWARGTTKPPPSPDRREALWQFILSLREGKCDACGEESVLRWWYDKAGQQADARALTYKGTPEWKLVMILKQWRALCARCEIQLGTARERALVPSATQARRGEVPQEPPSPEERKLKGIIGLMRCRALKVGADPVERKKAWRLHAHYQRKLMRLQEKDDE